MTTEQPSEIEQEIFDKLSTVLADDAAWNWMHTEIPALGTTPKLAIRNGRAQDVLQVVETYRDNSFS